MLSSPSLSLCRPKKEKKRNRRRAQNRIKEKGPKERRKLNRETQPLLLKR
jgi:hypothetical protein